MHIPHDLKGDGLMHIPHDLKGDGLMHIPHDLKGDVLMHIPIRPERAEAPSPGNALGKNRYNKFAL